MARYIFNEVKKQLNDEFGIRFGFKNDEGAHYDATLIIKAMFIIAHEQYKCTAPGEIPDEKIDEYKDEVCKRVCNLILIMEYVLRHGKRDPNYSSYIVGEKGYYCVLSMMKKLSKLINLGIADDIDLRVLGLKA